ncbi:hypothetical protein C8R44DRAFT_734033 [Mycena epipterygia]|nr:hypothetical protein C8R44DRAFT_734033 [Mycena epipterygia]
MFGSHIETVSHGWLADCWPLDVRNAIGIPKEGDTFEDWVVVPRNFVAQLGWAYMGRNPTPQDTTQPLLLLYKNPHVYPGAPANSLYPVGVRVQGFVEKCNLRPLGNWNGEGPPQGALQFIALSGGPLFGEQFQGCLGQPNLERDRGDTMFIARRVFTKLTTINRAVPSVISAGDDPMNWARRVQNGWRVISKVNVGMFVLDEIDPTEGDTVPCEPMSISEGDFVDVCVGFDIVTRYMRGVPSHQVHLTLQHILLLKAAEAETPMETEAITYNVHAPGMAFT